MILILEESNLAVKIKRGNAEILGHWNRKVTNYGREITEKERGQVLKVGWKAIVILPSRLSTFHFLG